MDCARAVVCSSVVLVWMSITGFGLDLKKIVDLQLGEDAVQSREGAAGDGEEDPGGVRGLFVCGSRHCARPKNQLGVTIC